MHNIDAGKDLLHAVPFLVRSGSEKNAPFFFLTEVKKCVDSNMADQVKKIADAYRSRAEEIQADNKKRNQELVRQSSVPYTRYAPIFRCILPYFESYERSFFAVSYSISLISLFSEAFATLLHLQTSNSILFGDIEEANRWGYIIGLVATFFAGASVLLPFSKSAGECREVSALIARHLVTAEDVPMTIVYRIYNQNTLCFRHPTIRRGCTIEELISRNPEGFIESEYSRSFHPGLEISHSASNVAGRAPKQPSIPFVAYSEMLVCASRGFDRLTVRFGVSFYVIALIQLLFTAATALFHGNNLQISSSDVSNLLGLLCGFVGTISGGILAVVPIETAFFRCRNAYCVCNEYLISEMDLPASVIQSLYETPCLCFKNPMMKEECSSLLDVA